ncbi:hypothetical protein UFOVP592_46 [uncultured Caudovirales phage]|uniref:Uncharacterized protein n=1 Tax=uncultured Caudovirales phage TaxID=2100421 RepID=A0A6J5MYP3_9CAUD|nr:hypothetical protein UFOVP592_46 [uncultured Caudovirales phage]
MNESLVANKWYPHYRGPGRAYENPYPTPQSILRRAVGAEEYIFVSETVTTEHIRAAVIMPLDVPFQHLLSEVPWGMSYRTDSWRMLVVSVLDPYAWIELARASGAIGWMKNHTQTYTYNWEPPVMDEHGLKRRPGNALGVTSKPRVPRERGRPQKFIREHLLEDLRDDKKTHAQLAEKHGISTFTVMKFAQMHGLSKGQRYVKT